MKRKVIDFAGIALAFVLLPCTALAFDSGSTGADGDFNPPVSIKVPLPTDGILNYRSVNIPLGVTVRFKRNDMNTPVTILVAGDAVIAGTINLDGESAPATGLVPGDDNPLDDGLPGKGGPGGFDGGFGGLPTTGAGRGQNGLGPGGGGGAQPLADQDGLLNVCGGGGGHATAGQNGGTRLTSGGGSAGGPIYGSDVLLPMIGGSGGGGGSGEGWQGGGGGRRRRGVVDCCHWHCDDHGVDNGKGW
jgi:hypothetical protein